MAEDRSTGRGFRVVVVPEDGGDTRSFRIGRTGVRVVLGAAAATLVLLVVVVGSWWHLAVRAARADDLEARLEAVDGQRTEVEALVSRLEEVERRYDRLREMFGSDSVGPRPGLWLPRSGSGPGGAAEGSGGGGAPTTWPLTRSGFVTQSALEGDDGGHPGLDIAVPSHSYIRAAGGGTVVEVGEEPVYGRFVVLDHGDGYRSLYGHASATLVEPGRHVRRSEVIALTGSTGRSSAPHLHFEILRDGEPVDPLSLMGEP